jgi:hypothetical protein
MRRLLGQVVCRRDVQGGELRLGEETAGAVVGGQQALDLVAQGLVATAGPVEEGGAGGGVGDLNGLGEEGFVGHGGDSGVVLLPLPCAFRNGEAPGILLR